MAVSPRGLVFCARPRDFCSVICLQDRSMLWQEAARVASNPNSDVFDHREGCWRKNIFVERLWKTIVRLGVA